MRLLQSEEEEEEEDAWRAGVSCHPLIAAFVWPEEVCAGDAEREADCVSSNLADRRRRGGRPSLCWSFSEAQINANP